MTVRERWLSSPVKVQRQDPRSDEPPRFYQTGGMDLDDAIEHGMMLQRQWDEHWAQVAAAKSRRSLQMAAVMSFLEDRKAAGLAAPSAEVAAGLLNSSRASLNRTVREQGRTTWSAVVKRVYLDPES